jgi:hypothetical protein
MCNRSVYFHMNKQAEKISSLVPRVRYASEEALRGVCEELLQAYTLLTHRVVSERLRARGLNALAWSELDRLMLGIASFEELIDEGLRLVLASTGGNGALYAHELNARLARCINQHNAIFFHETTSVSEPELQAGLSALLTRVLVTSAQSHYNALLGANFRKLVAWDADEWLLCPVHRVSEYKTAIVQVGAGALLQEDITLMLLEMLGLES